MSTNRTGRILVVDDDEDVLQAAKLFLKQHVAKVEIAKNPASIPQLLHNNSYDLVLLDMNFTEDVSSGKEGFKWLQKILDIDASLAVVLITAYGNVEKAVQAIKMGATDFVLKPWQNEKLLATTHAALNLTASRRETDTLRARHKQLNAQINQHYQDMIGQSSVMNKVFQTVEKVAKTPASVLITGENGTGKELVARALHKRSGRASDVFISVDIGAIPENLFESELFGHTKGAFTDAKEARPGRFEIAHGGTLFLDEIGNMPLNLQAKLLSVIEMRKVTRVGSNKPVDIDIRLICATNEPIQEMAAKGKFRQDLLYRINTIHVELPPLRERGEDIPLLAGHFLKEYAKKYNKHIETIATPALKKLTSYHWPGNVRELQHAVERAVIMTDHPALQADDFLLTAINNEAQPLPVDNYNLEEVEKNIIQKALDTYEGNISKAADELGLSRASLYRRMEKYNL